MNDKPLPPHDKEAEMAVIGCGLRSPARIDVLADIVRWQDFYSQAHQWLWRILVELRQAGKQIDAVLVFAELKRREHIDDVGHAYLAELWQAAAVGGENHAEIVRKCAIRRNLIDAARAIEREAEKPTGDTDYILDQAERQLSLVFQRRYGGNELVDMAEVMRASLEDLDQRSGKHPNPKPALPSPWSDLDEITTGFHKSELIILAARPSIGKTVVAANIIAHLAEQGKRVFFATLEQGRNEIGQRLLSKWADVGSYKLRKARFDDVEAQRIHQAAEELSGWPLILDDNSRQSAARILSSARRVQAKGGLDLVVIDYLQLMEGEGGRQGDNEIIGRNTMRMKQLAREFDIPVILLAQLNRQLENRKDPRPRLADLRGSGEIEQHADTVLMLHKPQAPDKNRDEDTLEVFVQKQRNGPLGEVILTHRKRFFDVVSFIPKVGGDAFNK